MVDVSDTFTRPSLAGSCDIFLVTDVSEDPRLRRPQTERVRVFYGITCRTGTTCMLVLTETHVYIVSDMQMAADAKSVVPVSIQLRGRGRLMPARGFHQVCRSWLYVRYKTGNRVTVPKDTVGRLLGIEDADCFEMLETRSFANSHVVHPSWLLVHGTDREAGDVHTPVYTDETPAPDASELMVRAGPQLFYQASCASLWTYFCDSGGATGAVPAVPPALVKHALFAPCTNEPPEDERCTHDGWGGPQAAVQCLCSPLQAGWGGPTETPVTSGTLNRSVRVSCVSQHSKTAWSGWWHRLLGRVASLSPRSRSSSYSSISTRRDYVDSDTLSLRGERIRQEDGTSCRFKLHTVEHFIRNPSQSVGKTQGPTFPCAHVRRNIWELKKLHDEYVLYMCASCKVWRDWLKTHTNYFAL